ncbi:MAG: SHOCT domain-containing protein [Rhodomicrobium sp.]
MQQLTEEGRQIVDDMARRHGVSRDAVMNLLFALIAGQGTQAQFNHPDLGGMGQWSQGGMIMIGDMFNNALKYRVDALCSEIASLLQRTEFFITQRPAQSQQQSQSGSGFGVSLFVPGTFSSGNWWPMDLGVPSSTGAQNNLRYAFFPASRRLAIEIGGKITIYETGDHQISGFSQQQSGDQSLTFTSQYGLVRVADLPTVTDQANSAGANAYPAEAAVASPMHAADLNSASSAAADTGSRDASRNFPPPVAPFTSGEDVFAKIERLAELREKGIVTEQEFEAKKTDLLNRL